MCCTDSRSVQGTVLEGGQPAVSSSSDYLFESRCASLIAGEDGTERGGKRLCSR